MSWSVTEALSFTSKISIEYKDKQINSKTIMSVMSLGIPKNTKIKIITEGDEEEQVIKGIDQLMEKEGVGI
ncbi:HPr family phosphocarrier protein [Priestia endophytica]|uniref:HPr family phosphocarrier protein n=1 Tax=Priestia endophytica TaxID=135735 RepID=UPI000DCA5C32|nr:hypothetical protein A4U60_21025 [Priestia endophytica]